MGLSLEMVSIIRVVLSFIKLDDPVFVFTQINLQLFNIDMI